MLYDLYKQNKIRTVSERMSKNGEDDGGNIAKEGFTPEGGGPKSTLLYTARKLSNFSL